MTWRTQQANKNNQSISDIKIWQVNTCHNIHNIRSQHRAAFQTLMTFHEMLIGSFRDPYFHGEKQEFLCKWVNHWVVYYNPQIIPKQYLNNPQNLQQPTLWALLRGSREAAYFPSRQSIGTADRRVKMSTCSEVRREKTSNQTANQTGKHQEWPSSHGQTSYKEWICILYI